MDPTAPTLAWWTLLRSVAVLNIAAWLALAWWLWRQRGHWPPDTWLGRRGQWLLAGGYVLGCAWRSALPVFDVPRMVLVDSVWSSVLVGRSVATVAELCFAAQWALLLREAARETGHRGVARAARLLLPAIALAELCSWHAVLSTSNLGHAIEESLWALGAALVLGSFIALRRQVQPRLRRLMALWTLAGGVYLAYMLAVDVPMYAGRWLGELQRGHAPLPLLQGVLDAGSRWVVSHDWAHWRGEVGWMTVYFSVAVWLSLSLVAAPRLFQRQPLARAQPRAPARAGGGR